MKNQELTERYIYSVTRYLKKNEREDIAKELESIIEDMLEEQYGGKEPNEYQMKALLSELGTPLELYEKYSQDGSDCLIGAPYFGTYKYIMKIVAVCIVFGMFVASCITFITEQQVWYTWYVIVLFAALGIGTEIMKLVEGHYTKRLLLVTAVEDGISAVLVIFWLINDSIVNPVFFTSISDIFTNGEAWLNNMMSHFNLFFMAVILFALALDFGTTLIKTEKQ